MSMEIDSTTLSDLEVFHSDGERGGLFGLVDQTQTSVGSDALRSRFVSPESDVSGILRVQDAVRFFSEHPSLLLFDETTVDSAQKYLRSQVAVSTSGYPGALSEHAWMRVRYARLLEEVEYGVDSTLRLFRETKKQTGELLRHDLPELVSQLISTIDSVAKDVIRHDPSRGRLLVVDRNFRTNLRADIDRAVQAIGELDALSAMASATVQNGWVFPVPKNDRRFKYEAADLHHPFVSDPVANPAHLSGGSPVVFLTGPNMAGKTTYLRSVGVALLLAQVGMGVPASSFDFTPVETLFTSLNPRDNLRQGVSYFYAEILRVKEAAQHLANKRRALVIFDEVFKGTNVRDATEASAEVILGFSNAESSGCIFSSHLTELVEVLEGSESIKFCYFDGEVVGGAPRFTYRLEEGFSDKRFGMLLLRQANIPELIAQIASN